VTNTTTDATPTRRRGTAALGPFLSPAAGARYLGRGRTHIYKLMDDDILPWYEEDGVRGRRIRVADLDRLLRRGIK
jgi:hypothetical protein